MLGVQPSGRLKEANDYPVLPENWDAVRLCCAAQSQWQYSPSGRPSGLDYAACEAAATALGIEWAAAFNGLRIMESEILDCLPEK